MKLKKILKETAQQRYAVTIDFYVYATDDAQAKNQAAQIVKELNNKYDNKAGVLSIDQIDFGSREPRRV